MPTLKEFERELEGLAADVETIKDADLTPDVARYEPHAKQKLFHAAAQTHDIIVAVAGIRSGKSIAGANEFVGRALAEPKRCLFVAPTYGDASEILNETLLNYLPPLEIKRIQKNDHRIELHNGSIIIWRSADKPERIRATGDVDIVWCDEAEQYPKYVYELITGRVSRVGGKILITTSPQKWFGAETRKKASWIFELLAENGISLTPEVNEYYAGDLAAINWTAADNPYFGADKIAILRERHGPLWAAQELDGQYVDLYAEGVFKAEWFKVAPLPESFDHVLISYDPAISEKARADFSVAQVWGRVRDVVYLIAENRGRWNFPKQKELLKALAEKHKAHTTVIEDVAYQRALIEDLQRDGLAVKAVRPDGDKVARASRLSGPLSAGKVLFSKDVLIKNGKLNDEYINEFVSFPCWAHDDRVDAAGYGVHELLQGGGKPVYTSVIRDPSYDDGYEPHEHGGLSRDVAEGVGAALKIMGFKN